MEDNTKGQIFSADFLVGVIVVLFIMTSLQVYHSRLLEDIQEEERMVFQGALNSRTDTLLLFQGKPENWDNETVEVLGFSTGTPNELNQTKLVEYFSMKEDKAEKLLPVRGREFYLTVEDNNGSVVSGNGVDFERGVKSWDDAEDVYVSERHVSVPGTDGSSLRLVVW